MARTRRKSNKRYTKYTVIVSTLIMMGCVAYYSMLKIEEAMSNIRKHVVQFTGFNLKNVNISGANHKTKVLIRKNMGMLEDDSIFKLSTKEIYQNVMSIPWVKSAVVQKYLPNVINVKIEERIPIAIFQHNSIFSLIDADGILIEEIKLFSKDLPVVSGDNANKEVGGILKVISNFEVVKKNLETITFLRGRRWDIVVSGIKVKLPETNINEALDTLSTILKNGAINKNTAKSIDLRIPGNIIISGLKIKNRKSVV